MFLDYAHVFLVIAFTLIWGLIGQFSLIRNNVYHPETRPPARPPKPVSDSRC